MEYLTFNKFIAPNILISIYYIIALIFPIITVILAKKYIPKFLKNAKDFAFNNLSIKQKLLFIVLCITMFAIGELFLRIFFEFLIGYFDIHNALMKISN